VSLLSTVLRGGWSVRFRSHTANTFLFSLMHNECVLNHNYEKSHSGCWQSLFMPRFYDSVYSQLQYKPHGSVQTFMPPAMLPAMPPAMPSTMPSAMSSAMQYMVAGLQQGIVCQHPSPSFQCGICCNTNCWKYVAIPHWQNQVMLSPGQSSVTFPWRVMSPSWQPTTSLHTTYHVHVDVESGESAPKATTFTEKAATLGLATSHLSCTHPLGKEPLPDDDGFTLNPSRVISRTDKRTTLIIRNIPTKMTQSHLKVLISDYFTGKFDFLYVPCDWRTNGAFGYAFVNLKQVEDVLPFYERFHNFALLQSKSTKIWEVAYARLQGKIELEAHFATRARNPKIAPDFGLPSDTTETSTIESNTAETGPVNYSASSPKESRGTRRARARVQRQQTGSKEQPDLASEPRESRCMRRARAQAQKQQSESEQEFSARSSR